ncbi:MAG: penicillin-binding protein 2, partial [Pseudomonadales bacterium]|nr:penicillin-binding protein 2 [Pseudomonadales bacterium]
MRGRLYNWRVALLWFALVTALLALLLRLVYLQLNAAGKGHAFLKRQGDIRVLRNEAIAAGRGEIRDRHGDLLAYSTPVQSVW